MWAVRLFYEAGPSSRYIAFFYRAATLIGSLFYPSCRVEVRPMTAGPFFHATAPILILGLLGPKSNRAAVYSGQRKLFNATVKLNS